MDDCCPWHSRTCEPPYELCCTLCTERAHTSGTRHSDGSRCVLFPDRAGEDK